MRTIGKLLVTLGCLLGGSSLATAVEIIIKTAEIAGPGNGTITPTGTAYLPHNTNFTWQVEIEYGFINAQSTFEKFGNGGPFNVPLTIPQAPSNQVNWTGPQQVIQPGWTNVVVQTNLQRRIPPGPWTNEARNLRAAAAIEAPQNPDQ